MELSLSTEGVGVAPGWRVDGRVCVMLSAALLLVDAALSRVPVDAFMFRVLMCFSSPFGAHRSRGRAFGATLLGGLWSC